jgi:hypothetical protein
MRKGEFTFWLARGSRNYTDFEIKQSLDFQRVRCQSSIAVATFLHRRYFTGRTQGMHSSGSFHAFRNRFFASMGHADGFCACPLLILIFVLAARKGKVRLAVVTSNQSDLRAHKLL